MGKMNHERAGWAASALEAFTAETGQDLRHEKQEAVKDLLCDLMHYAKQNGMEPEGIMQSAFECYEGEIADDE